jgi:hypothetical protein
MHDQRVVDLEKAVERITGSTGNIASAAVGTASAVAATQGRIDAEVFPAISDAAASPVTDARLTEELSVWPFVHSTIPSGAFQPGAITDSDISDFAISVKKINSTRHHLI